MGLLLMYLRKSTSLYYDKHSGPRQMASILNIGQKIVMYISSEFPELLFLQCYKMLHRAHKECKDK